MDNGNNYRSAIISEPGLTAPGGLGVPTRSVESVLRTPFAGNVHALAPPLPQLPMQLSYGSGAYGLNGNYGAGFGSTYGNYFANNFGGYGGGYGGYNGYGAYNRFGGNGMNPLDPEARFIQMAEASSRSAFQSIESLVSAIGNIASMLDSTFFALTSSFRAILGVAANFGRLRGVFAQLWHTFAIFKGLTFIYKKILYWLHISNLDPSSAAFQKAFSEAVNESIPNRSKAGPTLTKKGQSPWPILAFISFIFTAPYLIMKLLGTVTNTVQEETRNPIKWVNPIETVAIYDFQSRNPNELTFHSGQRLLIAPKEIQQTQGLLNTGWGLATIDGALSGIVPINYVKSLQQIIKERESASLTENQQAKSYPPSDQLQSDAPIDQPKSDLMNITASEYPASHPSEADSSKEGSLSDIQHSS